MIAQSYYYTLVKRGQWDHPDWFHYAAYDHPPLPKYMFGLSLDLAGFEPPENLDRWMEWQGYERNDAGQWVPSEKGGDFSPPGEDVLYSARVPSAIFGVGGALAVFFIGLQLRGRFLGMIATVLVVANPLYLTHARRAMSDSFAECMVLASVAIGFWGVRLVWSNKLHWRQWLAFVLSASTACGLAALAKLNGGIAAVVVLAMLGVNWILSVRTRSRRPLAPDRPRAANLALGAIALPAVGAGSFALFVLLNPFMTASPRLAADAPKEVQKLATSGLIARAKFLVQFRREWTEQALANAAFRMDWLRTPRDRLQMTVWEGFGRYSVLGPRDIKTHVPRPDAERFSEYRRWTCVVWLPLFLWGVWWSGRVGWQEFRAGRPPLAWCLLLYTTAALATIALIPLNWNRYYLPIQPAASLVVPFGILCSFGSIAARLTLKPATA